MWPDLTHLTGMSLRLKVWLAANAAGLGLGAAAHWVDAHIHRYVWTPCLTIADDSGNGHTLTGANVASDPLVMC